MLSSELCEIKRPALNILRYGPLGAIDASPWPTRLIGELFAELGQRSVRRAGGLLDSDGAMAFSLRSVAFSADVPPGDHVATFRTETVLVGYQAGRDGGAIGYQTTTQPEHVIHASVRLF